MFEAEFPTFVRALARGLLQIECPKCEEPVNFWQRLVDAMEFGVFGNRYAAVGANVLWLTAKLDRGEQRLLHFVELGIPADASVERVYVTPQGSPDEGVRVPVFFRDPLVGHPAEQPLLMTSMPISGNPESVTFTCLIVWTSGGRREPAYDLLLAAVRAEENADRFGTVIAANAAAEIAIGVAIDEWLSSFKIGKERRGRFLSDEATYSAQVDVLLPIVCETIGLPRLPLDIAGALKRLRRLRNQAAHGDLLGSAVDSKESARGLAGASVAVALANELRSQLADDALVATPGRSDGAGRLGSR